MIFPDRETVDSLRREFPAGTRVILEKMDDTHAPEIGTMGTVKAVDDAGNLIMNWNNGSSLNVVPGVDRVTKMIMTDTVYRQLMEIRNSGETNMFDFPVVQRLAFEREYYDLVMYIEDHRSEYAHFIIYGREREPWQR